MPVEVKRAGSRVDERLDWLHAWHCLTGPAYGLIHPGLAQRMTAGAGILHSERNDSWVLDGPRHERDVEMVQMWVVPDAAGVTPSYEQLDISAELDAGGLVLVASGVPGHEDDAAIRFSMKQIWGPQASL